MMIQIWCLCVSFINEGQETIILYVESGHAPLAVEVLEGFGGGIDGGVGQGVGERFGGGVARGGDASVRVEKELN